jgi:MYXO-CTERM domain-containing protein
LVISPSIEACVTFFGCVTVAEFEIPLSLLQDSFLQDFDPIDVLFPLPMLAPGLDQAAMADAEVGQIVNLEVPIGNDGSLSVYGDARIEGSTDFSVYPSTFDALPATEDGLVVTFAPTTEGPQTAELVLSSNDPGLPEFRIPLSANGVAPDASDGGENPDEETKAVNSCGCTSGSAGAGGSAALIAAAMLLLHRRRRV